MFVTVFAALLQTEIHEYYVRVRHPIIGWLVIGLIAGWLAGKLSRGRGFGCITDIVLGLIGAVLGMDFHKAWHRRRYRQLHLQLGGSDSRRRHHRGHRPSL